MCWERNDVGENVGCLSTFVENVVVVMATHDYPRNVDEKKNVGCPTSFDVTEPFSRPPNVAENEHYRLKTVA